MCALKLGGGIHAAKGPATLGGQGPVALVDVQGFNTATSNLKPREAVS
ncbi:hypothetical protein IPQ79_22010 [Xanthomonas perforans]|nr:hypothetical protein [Xanthomonas perforans]